MAISKNVDWDGLVYYDGKIKDFIAVENESHMKVGGNVSFSELPAPSASNVNYMFKINEDFTSDNKFEQVDKTCKAGTIVYVADIDEVYLYRIWTETLESTIIVNEITNITNQVNAVTEQVETVGTTVSETKAQAEQTAKDVEDMSAKLSELEEKVTTPTVEYDEF